MRQTGQRSEVSQICASRFLFGGYAQGLWHCNESRELSFRRMAGGVTRLDIATWIVLFCASVGWLTALAGLTIVQRDYKDQGNETTRVFQVWIAFVSCVSSVSSKSTFPWRSWGPRGQASWGQPKHGQKEHFMKSLREHFCGGQVPEGCNAAGHWHP
jgi:hypothetical protein